MLPITRNFVIISTYIDITMDNILTPLKAVSEKIRVRLLLLLGEEDACVCELMSVFGMPQSKLSHHLITLRDAGLLRDEKRGRWNYYRVDPKHLTRENRELVATLSRLLANDATVAGDRRKLKSVKARMQICC